MALPVFRGCRRLSSTFITYRLFVGESLVLNRPGPTRLPSSFAAPAAAAVRPYSSQPEPPKWLYIRTVPHPFYVLRRILYSFLIRTFFDKEFDIDEFGDGAKQAFCRVTRLMSECKFEDLEGLMDKDLIGVLKEKCKVLPLDYRKALFTNLDEISWVLKGFGTHYDKDGRQFLRIQMIFQYPVNVNLPFDTFGRDLMIKIDLIGGRQPCIRALLVGIYEFQREVTRGASPDWTITRAEHPKILN